MNEDESLFTEPCDVCGDVPTTTCPKHYVFGKRGGGRKYFPTEEDMKARREAVMEMMYPDMDTPDPGKGKVTMQDVVSKYEAFQEQEKKRINELIAVPQITQNRAASVASLTNDFRMLAHRIRLEVPDEDTKKMATDLLVSSFLHVLRGMTL